MLIMMLIMSMFESLTMLRWTSCDTEWPEVPVDLQEVGRDNEWRDPRICFYLLLLLSFLLMLLLMGWQK